MFDVHKNKLIPYKEEMARELVYCTRGCRNGKLLFMLTDV